MKIVVCLKRVPDTAARIRIAEDGRSIDATGVKFIISPYDEFALEAALRVRDGGQDVEIVVVTLGATDALEQLRAALAMGADSAVLLKADGAEGLAVARVLAAELPALDADLVLFGMKAADDDEQQVGPMTAELLSLPCVTVVSELTIGDGRVTCQREVEGGVEIMESPLPTVVSMTKGPHEPRYPSLKGIMAAKRKPIQEKEVASQALPARLRSLEYPPERPPGRIVGHGPDAVPELVRLLREEAKVL